MDRRAIKAKAKEFAFQNKWNIWKPLLLYMVIAFAVSFCLTLIIGMLKLPQFVASLLELAMGLALMPMAIGLASYCLKLVNGKEVDAMTELLSRYKDGSTFPIIKTMFLAGLFIFLWSLLFVIPGLIKSYAYSMSFYLMADDENLGGNDAITKSKELMKGHKWDLFVLQLSFIGWILLSMLTCGVLTVFYVGPYMQMAQLIWYEENIIQIEEPAQEVVAEQAE